MKRLVLSFAAILSIPCVTAAAVTRHKAEGERPLITALRNAVLSASAGLGNYNLPATEGFRVTQVSTRVNIASGGGAGNTVVRISDGIQDCDATLTCAASQTTGNKQFTLSGTCFFSPGALLQATVVTAGCTTTQPSVVMLVVAGYWQ